MDDEAQLIESDQNVNGVTVSSYSANQVHHVLRCAHHLWVGNESADVRLRHHLGDRERVKHNGVANNLLTNTFAHSSSVTLTIESTGMLVPRIRHSPGYSLGSTSCC